LLADGAAWREAIQRLAGLVRSMRPELLIGIESRGFLAAAPLAIELGIGFAMIRKRGKLPGTLIGHDYALEYGTDRVEMQADAVTPGQRVVVLDDLLATGGTMQAAIALLRLCGADVAGAAFIIELDFLAGRDRLDVPVESLMRFGEND
jgi:adenine phosphoribosyltransferase